MAVKQGRGRISHRTALDDLRFEPLSLPAHTCPLPHRTCRYPTGSHEDYEQKEDHAFSSRIEKLAHEYLAGKPLFIQSAALQGPFNDAWLNPWLLQNQQDVVKRNQKDALRLSEVARQKRRTLRQNERAERAKRLQADGLGRTLYKPVDLTEDKENLPALAHLVVLSDKFMNLKGQQTRGKVDGTTLFVAETTKKVLYNEKRSALDPESSTHELDDSGPVIEHAFTESLDIHADGASRSPDVSGREIPSSTRLHVETCVEEGTEAIRSSNAHYVRNGFTAANLEAISAPVGGFTNSLKDTPLQELSANLAYQNPLRSRLARYSEEEEAKAAANVKRCTECLTCESARWLKGPTGPATLCSRCGGKYYRQRKRAEKLTSLISEPTSVSSNLPDALSTADGMGSPPPGSLLQAKSIRQPLASISTPKTSSRLRAPVSRSATNQHRSVIKSMFPKGMSSILSTLCPTATLLGGFATSPLVKRPRFNDVVVTVEESLVDATEKRIAPKRARFMTFDTPPTRSRFNKHGANDDGVSRGEVSSVPQREKTNSSMIVENAVDKSLKDTVMDDERVNNLYLPDKSLRGNSEECEMQVDCGSANGGEPPSAGCLSRPGDKTHQFVDQHSAVPSRPHVADVSQQHMECATSPKPLGPDIDSEIRLESALAQVSTHLENSAGISAAQGIIDAEEKRLAEVVSIQEEIPPLDGLTSILVEAETTDTTHSIGSLYMSTQAALVHARDDFHEGLESPDKSISGSSVRTPVNFNHDIQHGTPDTGAFIGIESVRHLSNTVDGAGSLPINTQDLFADAPDFCFSTEKKKKKYGSDNRRASFEPSPLVRQMTSEHGDNDNDDGASVDEDTIMTEAGVDEMYADIPTVQKTPLSMEGWVEHGFERTPFQSAQANADLESLEIEAIVDDTLSFLDPWNVAAEMRQVD